MGLSRLHRRTLVRPRPTRHRACLVILLTGWGNEHTGDGSGRGLADRVLNKPVRLKELLQATAELTPYTSGC
jgi:hypothetical protein